MIRQRHFSAIHSSSDPGVFSLSPVRLVHLALVGALLLRGPTHAFTPPAPAARARHQSGLGSCTRAATRSAARFNAARPLPTRPAAIDADKLVTVRDKSYLTKSNGHNPVGVTLAWWSDRSSFRRQGASKRELHKAVATTRAMAGAMVLAAALILTPLSADAAHPGGHINDPAIHVVPRSNPSTSFDDGPCKTPGSKSHSPDYPCSKLAKLDFSTGFDGYRGTGSFLLSSASAATQLLIDYALSTFIAAMIAGVVMVAQEPDRLPKFPVAELSALGRGTSVIQVSVAMHVAKRHDPNSILSVLDRLASTANTDSREGVQELVSAVALEILRRKSSVVSASVASKHYQKRDNALREYGFWSARERSKFEQETVTNYGGNKLAAPFASDESIPISVSNKGRGTTLAVVTLLLAIDGEMSRPQPAAISSLASVEDALGKIVVDAKIDSCLRSAEILWTPSDPSETLATMDVMVDYPELHPL